jgi:hypothetical protein
MKELKSLISYAHRKGFAVSFVGSKVLHDYAGMNPEAAKVMGYVDIQGKEIQIDKHQPLETQKRNLRHELVERGLMKAGEKYYPAHLTALKIEKSPITPKEIDTLAKIGQYEVTHVHDDGDLTIKSKGKEMVITTEGKTFIGGKMKKNKATKETKERVQIVKGRFKDTALFVNKGKKAKAEVLILSPSDDYHPEIVATVTQKGAFKPRYFRDDAASDLKKKGITKSEIKKLGLNSRTPTLLPKEKVSITTIQRLPKAMRLRPPKMKVSKMPRPQKVKRHKRSRIIY